MWPLIALAALQAVKGQKDKQKAAAVQGIQDSKVDLSDSKMNVPQPQVSSGGWKDAAMSVGMTAAQSALSGPAGKKPDAPVAAETSVPEVEEPNTDPDTGTRGFANRGWKRLNSRGGRP